MWFLLTPVVAVITFAAVGARPDMPTGDTLREEEPRGKLHYSYYDEFADWHVVESEGSLYFVAHPMSKQQVPDGLLYWSTGEVTDGVLLGGWAGNTSGHWILPDQARTTAGKVLWYSLVEQSVHHSWIVPAAGGTP